MNVQKYCIFIVTENPCFYEIVINKLGQIVHLFPKNHVSMFFFHFYVKIEDHEYLKVLFS